MKLIPLSDNLIVKALPREEQTKSGIVLPDSGNDRPEEGEVIAIGEGKRNDQGERIPTELKVGQRVVFKKYSPTEFKLDGEKYLILSESDILAIIS